MHEAITATHVTFLRDVVWTAPGAADCASRGDGRDLHPGDRGVRHPLVLGVRVGLAPGYHLVVVALDAARRRGSDDLDDRYKCKHREQLGQHARHPRAPTAATMALERK